MLAEQLRKPHRLRPEMFADPLEGVVLGDLAAGRQGAPHLRHRFCLAAKRDLRIQQAVARRAVCLAFIRESHVGEIAGHGRLPAAGVCGSCAREAGHGQPPEAVVETASCASLVQGRRSGAPSDTAAMRQQRWSGPRPKRLGYVAFLVPGVRVALRATKPEFRCEQGDPLPAQLRARRRNLGSPPLKRRRLWA
jgi:hypothetical protein